jgi:uncharacterized membrane protein YvlD (DUF360 family)
LGRPDVSIVLTTVTDAEHPSAAGAALGLVPHGWNWSSVGIIIIGSIILSIMRGVMRPRLVNLLLAVRWR